MRLAPCTLPAPLAAQVEIFSGTGIKKADIQAEIQKRKCRSKMGKAGQQGSQIGDKEKGRDPQDGFLPFSGMMKAAGDGNGTKPNPAGHDRGV